MNIMSALNQSVIDLKQLQKLTFQGVPDEIKGLRPLVWRVLLNHLPLDTAHWADTIESSRVTYEAWKQELIIKPKISGH